MRAHARIAFFCLLASAIGLHFPALAGRGKWAAGEQPLDDVMKQGPPKASSTYGMCNGPQNADAFPSSPVPVEAGQCDNSQTFSATSDGPSTGDGCGGFTVAFGPKGALRPNLKHVILKAEWGDVPLTAANCASAKIAAVGWGERCTDRADATAPSLATACTSTQWEKIGGPTQGKGFWNTTSQVCYVSAQVKSSDKRYKTLNIDIIATVVESGKTVRKRAKGTIRASYPNGKCFSTPAEGTKRKQ